MIYHKNISVNYSQEVAWQHLICYSENMDFLNFHLIRNCFLEGELHEMVLMIWTSFIQAKFLTHTSDVFHNIYSPKT